MVISKLLSEILAIKLIEKEDYSLISLHINQNFKLQQYFWYTCNTEIAYAKEHEIIILKLQGLSEMSIICI